MALIFSFFSLSLSRTLPLLCNSLWEKNHCLKRSKTQNKQQPKKIIPSTHWHVHNLTLNKKNTIITRVTSCVLLLMCYFFLLRFVLCIIAFRLNLFLQSFLPNRHRTRTRHRYTHIYIHSFIPPQLIGFLQVFNFDDSLFISPSMSLLHSIYVSHTCTRARIPSLAFFFFFGLNEYIFVLRDVLSVCVAVFNRCFIQNREK